GVVFQDLRLFPHLSVRANLLYGAQRAKNRSDPGNIDAVVALLGLESALARALLMQPKALLLDEPLASLDAARKAEILPYLEKLVRETQIPMLYVSHALDEVAQLAERMVVVKAG